MPQAKVVAKVLPNRVLVRKRFYTKDRVVRGGTGRTVSRKPVVTVQKRLVKVGIGCDGRDGGPYGVCEVDARGGTRESRMPALCVERSVVDDADTWGLQVQRRSGRAHGTLLREKSWCLGVQRGGQGAVEQTWVSRSRGTKSSQSAQRRPALEEKRYLQDTYSPHPLTFHKPCPVTHHDTRQSVSPAGPRRNIQLDHL